MGLDAYAVNGISPARHARPRAAEDVANEVRRANEAGEAVVAFGGRTALEAGNAPRRYDVALDLAGLAGCVEHEPGDLTATVHAGTTLAALAELVREAGQMWPVEAPRPDRATVGGILAAATAGPSRLRYGHPRDWTLGVRAVTGDGRLTRAGGKVVKNVSGYDLTRFYAGSRGTLCVIVEASLKLWPLPEAERVLVARFDDVHDASAALGLLRRDGVELDAALSLDGAAAARIGEGRALAIVRLRGVAATVLRLADRVARALARGVVEDARPGLLADAIDLPLRAAIAVRLAVPESRMAEALGDAGAGVLRYAGAGTAYLLAEHAAPETILSLRRRVEALDGSAVLERAPAALRAAVETWGAPLMPLELARRIKFALDPRGTLSPGRFAGGL